MVEGRIVRADGRRALSVLALSSRFDGRCNSAAGA